MSNFRGTKAEMKSRLIRAFLMCAHADEGEGTGTTEPTPAPQINYEQLIAQARKEEKDKLYPKMQKLEEENKKLVQTGNDNLIKIGDLTQSVSNLTAELNKYKSGEVVNEEVLNLKSQIDALTAENQNLKDNAPDVEKIRAEIKQEYEIKAYVTEQRTAHKDDVLGSFLEEITGTTKEEIDASVEKAKAKTLSIKKDLGLVDEEGNPVEKKPASKKSAPKQAPAKAPAMNPVDNSGSNISRFDADYIRSLDPASPEYAEFRKSLGLK